ncbi:MAG TPA: family 20 glycosylhydrolase [Gemmatimonadales bacterium]|nr:family 20 glycosylhydrolase [Gemmatimonadales bacterium]
MRTRPLLVLTLLWAGTATTALAQTNLHLRWELVSDSITPDGGASRAQFTLTNRDTWRLPATGWAIYFSALHSADSGTVGSGFAIQDVMADLHRVVPATGFSGLAPGASIKIPYRTYLLPNRSFAPAGPYIVYDSAKTVGVPLRDYVAAPFERSVGVVTPAMQFTRDSLIRDIPVADLPPIFPTPAQVTRGTGELHLAAMPAITASPDLANEAQFARDYFAPYVSTSGQDKPLRLELGQLQGQSSAEAYELTVDPAAGIRIVGPSAAGVFYGLQSLRAMLPTTAGSGVTLPALHVVDAPRFGYRGFMLDVARNFHPKAAVLRTLDLMARYKLNVFHMHLTDDEGWRIEIAGLPELTTVGARRGHTLDSKAFLQPAYGSGPLVGQPYGSGFYSRADYIDIVRYAAARHIEVIPEIEMPGHARAAVKAMEARSDSQYRLTDPQDQSKYESVQGYPDNVMNPALESTYNFIQRVVMDLAAMHREAGAPLRHIHMGGDEVPAGVWTGSPAVQKFMAALGLNDVNDLWYAFYFRIEQILKTQNVRPSGWEEIAVRKTRRDGRPVNIVNPSFAERGWRAYVWNNVAGWGAEDLAYRLANGGYDVVLSPVTNYYFDLAWNQNPEEIGQDWGGYNDMEKPFEFIPFDYYHNTKLDRRGNPLPPGIFTGKDRLTDYGKSHIVGLQGNLWSETLGGDGRLDYMLVPRMFGLAERAWAPDPAWATEKDSARADSLYREDWSRLSNVVGKRELPRLDREVPALMYRIPTPGLRVRNGAVYASVELPGFTLRYTTDGSQPSARSPVVRGPIPLRGTIRVAAFSTTGRAGHAVSVKTP